MIDRLPCVYILSSGRNGTLYVGVTSDPMRRIHQHRTGETPGFASRYEAARLVWFEMADTMEAAIAREKQLKNLRRAWKLALIEKGNPLWRDLAEEWGFPPLPSS